MPKFKEKPRTRERGARKPAMLSPRQAAKLLKDRYVRQLDQKRADRENETQYAVNQVEGAGQAAAEEATDHLRPRSPRQRERPIKGRPGREAAGAEDAPFYPEGAGRNRGADAGGTTAVPRERRVEFKTRQMAEARYSAPASPNRPASLDHPSIESIYPTGQRGPMPASGRAGRTNAPTAAGPRRQPRTGAMPGRPEGRRAGRVSGGAPPRSAAGGRYALKERPAARAPALKRRDGFYPKAGFRPKSSPRPLKAGRAPLRSARQAAQRQMVRRTVQQTAKAARRGAAILRRVIQAAAKAVTSLISALAGLVGGSVLLVLLIAVIIVAAVASSPLGIFFTEEPSAPDTLSVSQAVASIHMDYNARLETLQAGGYDNIVIHGQGPDWAEVLAVFAVRTSGTDQGVDVATLDSGRVALLKEVFWDMTALSAQEEEIDHPASGSSAAWTETVLHITVTPRSAEEMRTAYAFTEEQNSALDALLADKAALSALAGSLAISDADARELLNALPADLSPERRAVVETALALHGKVNYFWGGKSLTIGWDSRWGTLRKVTAAGSSTTGTYRPYGLDCSGMVDWVFYNVSGGAYVIGHGGGARAQHTYCGPISWDQAQPGDLAFYPEDSHVGIVGGRDENGNLLIIHCAFSANNVVITGADGFTSVARPRYYGG